MCLLYERMFSNNTLKPTKMKGNLQRIHPDQKKDEDLNLFFRTLKDEYKNWPNVIIDESTCSSW